MPIFPNCEEVSRLLNRFHSELESIAMDRLGDEVNYNLLSGVLGEFEDTLDEFQEKLNGLYGKDGENNG